MRSFFDSNVLVYLFDQDAPEKKTRARSLLEREAVQNEALISSQVLQEFYVAVTRKLARPLPYEQAERAVHNLSQLPVVYIDLPLIMAAIKTGQRFDLSFWDSLIVEAAREGGASYLYTEDLQNGQIISGVEIRNPFSRETDV